MYRTYQISPENIPESWREFLSDYRPGFTNESPQTAASSATDAIEKSRVLQSDKKSKPKTEKTNKIKEVPVKSSLVSPAKTIVSSEKKTTSSPDILRGASARIVANMEISLTIPTATSARVISAKLLEGNRFLLNQHLRTRRSGKAGFTHLIGWAIVRAATILPVMNTAYTEVDGKSVVIRHDTVNLGLALDVKRKNRTRSLLVPSIKNASKQDSATYLTSYEELIHRVTQQKKSTLMISLGPQ